MNPHISLDNFSAIFLMITLAMFLLFLYRFYLFQDLALSTKLLNIKILGSIYLYSKWANDFKNLIHVLSLRNFGRQFFKKLRIINRCQSWNQIRRVLQEKKNGSQRCILKLNELTVIGYACL